MISIVPPQPRVTPTHVSHPQLVTAYGCLALSTDNDIVLKTYWSHASIHDKNDGSGWQVLTGNHRNRYTKPVNSGAMIE